MNYGEGNRDRSVFVNTNYVYYGYFEKLLRCETELCIFILTEERKRLRQSRLLLVPEILSAAAQHELHFSSQIMSKFS